MGSRADTRKVRWGLVIGSSAILASAPLAWLASSAGAELDAARAIDASSEIIAVRTQISDAGLDATTTNLLSVLDVATLRLRTRRGASVSPPHRRISSASGRAPAAPERKPRACSRTSEPTGSTIATSLRSTCTTWVALRSRRTARSMKM
jgi:hypothetical protein